MNLHQPQHNYEEIRDVVIYIMQNAQTNGVDEFSKLLDMTALALYKRDGVAQPRRSFAHGAAARLDPQDSEVVLDVVWDLFRQGIITLGLDAANPGWPWIRLSRSGAMALQHSPPRFYDRPGFVRTLQSEVTDLSPEALVYLEEAVAAFYVDRLLSTCVMLGAAAEIEFQRMLDVAKNSALYGKYFSRIGDHLYIRTKILRFLDAIKPALGFLTKTTTAELENNLNIMHSIISVARNEAGHPPGANSPSRDQVYVYLQLFIPFAKQLMQLRHELNGPSFPRLVRTT